MGRILVVEDEAAIAELLSMNLRFEGHEVRIAATSDEAVQAVRDSLPDLVVLDWMLPGEPGVALARRWRADARTRDLPIIMLTARSDERDLVQGLDAGADDYLAKPFDDRELLARVRAILRRTQHPSPQRGASDELRFMDLVLQPGLQQASCHGELLELTATEFGLLECLLRNPGQIVSKSQLSELVLGKKLEPFDRAIDMHLSNLRKKLPERTDGQPRFKTVRGRGYLWLEQV